eukprot:CAMPEP_0116549116 /NCGR_PEP_ID=MMETSP0397-20121206/4703_1 /TAXON_ID=216820 /ORGANISM="Cyclophora tenuis, Strain ECT3854" /LENGTH=131 /DNA_ID=CAMNT_0004073821 /DNA_START=801 /DNA_END=1193 /DNA_ORIENTATION=-
MPPSVMRPVPRPQIDVLEVLTRERSHNNGFTFELSDQPMAVTTSQEDIFGPFLAMQLLTMLVWFYMYSKRLPFLVGYIEKHKGEGLTFDDMSNPKSPHFMPKITPVAVSNPSDNLKNLFELPTLCYARAAW